MRLSTLGTAVIALSIALTGCVSQTPSPTQTVKDLSFSVVHSEESEKTIAILKDVNGKATWGDVGVLWNGKNYYFGPVADFDLRRFQVDGRQDAAEPVENGDSVTMIAAGIGTLQFMNVATGKVIASYEAIIPDNMKPAAPVPLEPANAATGVSLTPAWKWRGVTDPSGVSYSLQWSLDPLFTVALTTTKASLSAPSSDTEPGESLTAGRTYYWRVVASDGAGNIGAYSETYSFSTASQ